MRNKKCLIEMILSRLEIKNMKPSTPGTLYYLNKPIALLYNVRRLNQYNEDDFLLLMLKILTSIFF